MWHKAAFILIASESVTLAKSLAGAMRVPTERVTIASLPALVCRDRSLAIRLGARPAKLLLVNYRGLDFPVWDIPAGSIGVVCPAQDHLYWPIIKGAELS